MTLRPHERPATPTLRDQRRRWDHGDALPMAIGCTVCPDRKLCGGIHKLQDTYSCLDDCCGRPETCDGMCPNNPIGFRDHMKEVNGLELDSLPCTEPHEAPSLPAYVPYIYHGNRRVGSLDIEAVALPLRLFYLTDGRPKFASRPEVEACFGIGSDTAIVLVGSGRDKAIEAWWKLSEHRAAILKSLSALGVVLVTAPNYSMFTDEVRYNDMHAMKRIGTVWQEIVAAGIAGAYHLNARTPHDYGRLADLVAERPEITDVAFEFRTGASWHMRLPFHVAELTKLAARAKRPLHLVMIGGKKVLPKLRSAYARVTYIDTSAFMNAVQRQRLVVGDDGKMKKVPELTLIGQPIDGLLNDNLATMRSLVESI
jgi:hypothetical protein